MDQEVFESTYKGKTSKINMIILYYFMYICNSNCKIENVTAFTLYGHKITVLRCSGNQ